MDASQLAIKYGVCDTRTHACSFQRTEELLNYPLPNDYKDLMRQFGFCYFGELQFFHPDARSSHFRLPDATLERHEVLGECFDLGLRFGDVNPPMVGEPTIYGTVLGIVGTRRYLVWRDFSKSWLIYDLDDESVVSLGSNLVDFLDKEYTASLKEGPSNGLGFDIWPVGSPFCGRYTKY